MPPKKAAQVHLVAAAARNGGFEDVLSAHTTLSAANDVAQKLRDEEVGVTFDVISLDLEDDSTKTKKTAEKTSKAAPAKKSAKAKGKNEDDDEDDDVEDEIDEEEPEVKKKKRKAPEKRKQTVDIVSDALAGLKLLFTGTFSMARPQCEDTARAHGATIVSTLKGADYIVVGTKAGAKKLEEIDANNYATWSEEEFMQEIGADEGGGKKQKSSN